MAAGSSSSHLFHIVDDFYFSALHDDDDIFPISDEKYAHELQFQEALISSSSSSLILPLSSFHQNASSSSSSKKHPIIMEEEGFFCEICMDRKTASDMFHNINVCGHLFCLECISRHVGAKIKENIRQIKCPDPKCKGLIGPEICRSILPKQVLERWEESLCESLILGSQKFYCPCWWMMVVKPSEFKEPKGA